MIDADGLRSQINAAISGPRCRYIVTAIVDDEEYDVGEMMIGQDLDAEATETALLENVRQELQRLKVDEARVASVSVMLAEAPFLW